MIDLEKALEAELTKLRTAVNYVEEANERTSNALKAAEELKEAHEQWKAQQLITRETQELIVTLQQRVAALEAREGQERLNTVPSNGTQLNQPWVPLAMSFALVGVSSWLMLRKKSS